MRKLSSSVFIVLHSLVLIGAGIWIGQSDLFVLLSSGISADTPSGTASTLSVYVNKIEWQQTASFYGKDGDSQLYLVRIDDDGNTAVIFGDGKNGARLTASQENVTAVYRHGCQRG